MKGNRNRIGPATTKKVKDSESECSDDDRSTALNFEVILNFFVVLLPETNFFGVYKQHALEVPVFLRGTLAAIETQRKNESTYFVASINEHGEGITQIVYWTVETNRKTIKVIHGNSHVWVELWL